MKHRKGIFLSVLLIMFASGTPASQDISGFMVIDCLLPGQVRQLGKMTYLAARKAIRTTASDCEIRGGEFVAYDRANRASSLKVWLPLAKEGDAEAQNYVGEIFEKGMGASPDYGMAASWYLQSAEQGYSRAALNLGNLFEKGLGLEQDKAMAAYWYRKASGIEGLVAPEREGKSPAKIDKQSRNILIVEPPLKTRGDEYFLATGKRTASFPVVGQVNTKKTIDLVLVGGQEAQVIGNSLFRSQVTGQQNKQELEIVVVYADGNSEGISINLTGKLQADEGGEANISDLLPKSSTASPALKGKQHALVIGNNRYPQLLNLETAINDAVAVADTLKNEYGFDVTLVKDASRYAALSAINELRLNFSENDRLLVYYAGHGELDRINKRGHWLPVDAEFDNTANWISNITITDLLNTIPARQLIVIADSCYSGMMSRSALGVIDQGVDEVTRKRMLKSLADTRTRTALTSGGVAPVLDSGGGQHSVFAKAFLDVLEKNQGALTGYELFRAVSGLVESRAGKLGFSQIPEYAPLKFAGHEAGDFVFVKKQK